MLFGPLSRAVVATATAIPPPAMLHPTPPPLPPSRLAVALVCATFLLAGADGCSSDPDVEGAKLYINNEEYDQALANLERAIANNPDNAEAHALKAEVLRLKAEDLPQPAPRRPL